MHAVSSIAPVSGTRQSGAIYGVAVATARVTPAKANVASNRVTAPKNAPAAKPSQPATTSDPNLPFGLLQSATQPPASNAQASLDYDDLRLAMQSGNRTAAQQAYLRLQTDLSLSLPSTSNTAATTNSRAHLNVSA